jgi:hypothetical protein
MTAPDFARRFGLELVDERLEFEFRVPLGDLRNWKVKTLSHADNPG